MNLAAHETGIRDRESFYNSVAGLGLISILLLWHVPASYAQNRFYDGRDRQIHHQKRSNRRQNQVDRNLRRQQKPGDVNQSSSYERDKSRYGDWKSDPEMQRQFAEFGKAPEDPGFDWREFQKFVGAKELQEQKQALEKRNNRGLKEVMSSKARSCVEYAKSTKNKRAAAHDYAEAAKICREYPGSVPGESELSLLTKSANLYATVEGSREGRIHWQRLMEIDSTNPQWPYLLGQSYLQGGMDTLEFAERSFKKAATATGGDSRYRLQAKNALAQFPALYKKRAAYVRQLAKRRQNMRRGPSPGWSGGSSSSYRNDPVVGQDTYHPSSVPSYERQAREAESRGDYSAADRLRGGGASGADTARYWGQ